VLGAAANASCGSVTIMNGSVDAVGGTGLGSGWGLNGGFSRHGRLVIEGGDVRASGTNSGCGVGTGQGSYGVSTVDELTIWNGNLTASRSSWGSGIGTGYNLYSGPSMVVTLTILNGNLTATSSHYGSGIGTGDAYDGTSTVVMLAILNGNITASSSVSGSAVGTGEGTTGGISGVVNLAILDGNITASSSSYGSGIRTWYGYYSGSTSTVGHLTVLNGNITASSSNYGSGIGSGDASSSGTSTVGNLTILNGNITASSSSSGSGIGSGDGSSSSPSVIETLSILGGRIKANGTEAGLGSGGDGSEVTVLTLGGSAVLLCDANASKFPVNASSIVFADASLTFETPRNRLFGVSPLRKGSLNLTLLYWSVTSNGGEPLSFLNGIFLQIGNANFPASESWDRSFCVSGVDHEYCSGIVSNEVKSLIVSVPSANNYSMKAVGGGVSGFFEIHPSLSVFEVLSDSSFFANAYFVFSSTAEPTASATAAIPTPTAHFTVYFQAFFHPKKLWIIGLGWLVFAPWD
jgi:hypothetical protein